MRTTLSLDDDVAAQLEALRAKQKLTFKEAVNSALRRGLSGLSEAPQAFSNQTDRYGILPFGEPGQRLGSLGRGRERREHSHVIPVDANILIYATDPRSERTSKRWTAGSTRSRRRAAFGTMPRG
ncbi:MAG: hypothetical protein JO099_23310 [Acidobacteriia bacterium]|nr:hypothetical protein [Terriglobia bacterium]